MRAPRLAFLLLACTTAFASIPAAAQTPPGPDPATVQRFGKGWKYPQAGWTVVHIEGEPYERGVQHGRLLAEEIAGHLRCFAQMFSDKAPEDAYKTVRT